MNRHLLPTVVTAAVLLVPASALADSGRMYVTAGSSRPMLRMLTAERLSRGGNVTFQARCSGGDLLVRISRSGRVSHTTRASARYGVSLTGTVTDRAFTGTLASWGPGCRARQQFTARRARAGR